MKVIAGQQKTPDESGAFHGAGDGARTRDLKLGKHAQRVVQETAADGGRSFLDEESTNRTPTLSSPFGTDSVQARQVWCTRGAGGLNGASSGAERTGPNPPASERGAPRPDALLAPIQHDQGNAFPDLSRVGGGTLVEQGHRSCVDSGSVLAAYNGVRLRQGKPPLRGFLSWDMTVLACGVLTGMGVSAVAAVPVLQERDELRVRSALVADAVAVADRATTLALRSLNVASSCVEQLEARDPTLTGPGLVSACACWRAEAP